MSQLAIDATTWQSANWAKQKGLYAEIFETVSEMDDAINVLSHKLAESNPEAMQLLKGNFWEGTDHWDELLEKRAEMSGKLVLSEFTSNAIGKFKSGAR